MKASPVLRRGETHGQAHGLSVSEPSLRHPLLCHRYLLVVSSSVDPCRHLLLPHQLRRLYHLRLVMALITHHSREVMSSAMLNLITLRRRHLLRVEITLLRFCFLLRHLFSLLTTLSAHRLRLRCILASSIRLSSTASSPRVPSISPTCSELPSRAGSEMASGLRDRQWLRLLPSLRRRRSLRSLRIPHRTRVVPFVA